MNYIYQTEFDFQGQHLIYIGRHKWSGEGVDPNYFGSSPLIKRLHVPMKVTLLEVVTDSTAPIREHYWIEQTLRHYGAYYHDTYLKLRSGQLIRRSWLDSYGPGTCINTHTNSGEQLHGGNSPEALLKKQSTLKGHNPPQSTILAAHTPEALSRMTSSKSKETHQRVTTAMRNAITDEILHQRAVTHAQNRDYSKTHYSTHPSPNTYLVTDGTHSGSVKYVLSFTHPEWYLWFTRRFKAGSTTVTRSEITLTLLYCIRRN